MAENMIKFLRGNVARLPAKAIPGAVYFTQDEGLYLGLEDETYHRYGDFITVANVNALPKAGAHETCMYYCEDENILAKWDGTEWVQINKQKTLAELGGVAQSVYDTKMTALAEADAANATAISNLSTYVGTIPTGTDGKALAESVVAYVNKKTDGIATSGNLDALATRVDGTESRLDALEGDVGHAAKPESSDGAGDGKEATGLFKAIDEAKATADAAYELAGTKATMEEVNNAIADAGHATQASVDTAISNLETAYKAADTALETKLQDNIDNKVDQTAYDTKVAELAGADTTLQGNIDAEATARANADNAQIARIAALEGTITGLSGAMHFKGVMTEIPADKTSYADGDVIIVGDKEYVFNKDNFVEFGDVSAEGDRIAALEATVGHAAEPESSEGANDSVPATGLFKAIADEQTRAEKKEAELAAADTVNLDAANQYTDDAINELNISDYVKKADADVAYAAADHNHNEEYDAKGAASAAETAAKTYADGLNTAMDSRVGALETASANHALKTEVAAVQSALDTYKTDNDAAVALKANAADVYKKTETYTKAEVDVLLADAQTWGSF